MNIAVVRWIAAAGAVVLLAFAASQSASRDNWGPAAIGFAIFCCSLVSGLTWRIGQKTSAIGLMFCVLLLEGYNVKSLIDRELVRSAQADKPRREALVRQDLARKQLDVAVKGVPVTTARLDRAYEAVAGADKDVSEKASLQSCAANCRTLLEAKARDARAELKSAQEELREERGRALQVSEARRKAYEAIEVPELSEGLAEVVGVDRAKLQLMFVVAYSLGFNGAAAFLLAFAGSGIVVRRPVGGDQRVPIGEAVVRPLEAVSAGAKVSEPEAAVATPAALTAPSSTGRVELGSEKSVVKLKAVKSHDRDFFDEMVRRRRTGSVTSDAFREAYLQWCSRHDISPLDEGDFWERVLPELKRRGVRGELIDGKEMIVGVALAA